MVQGKPGLDREKLYCPHAQMEWLPYIVSKCWTRIICEKQNDSMKNLYYAVIGSDTQS